MTSTCISQHHSTGGSWSITTAEVKICHRHSPMPDLLSDKLTQLSVPTSICQWTTSFLTDRQQVVRLGKLTSRTLTISTGAPQGCVLSRDRPIYRFPNFLFVTYTFIQSINSSEMCSLHLTHPSAHTPGAVGTVHSG